MKLSVTLRIIYPQAVLKKNNTWESKRNLEAFGNTSFLFWLLGLLTIFLKRYLILCNVYVLINPLVLMGKHSILYKSFLESFSTTPYQTLLFDWVPAPKEMHHEKEESLTERKLWTQSFKTAVWWNKKIIRRRLYRKGRREGGKNQTPFQSTESQYRYG